MIILETDDFADVRNNISNLVWNMMSIMAWPYDDARVVVYIRLLIIACSAQESSEYKVSHMSYTGDNENADEVIWINIF